MNEPTDAGSAQSVTDGHGSDVRSAEPFDPSQITRPDPVLLRYYILGMIVSNIAIVVVGPVLWFRYHTMRYRFDDKGVSMSWGILFRQEIYLTYRRIQDIHVTRNFIQRWLSLATVSVQTASGTSGAEMKIEGVTRPEALRDYLYAQMRGARGEVDGSADIEVESASVAAPDESLALLLEIRNELRTVRERLEQVS